MNELYFIIHASLLAVLSLAALYAGKEVLISFIMLQTILANLFVSKQIMLCGFNAIAAEPFIIGSALSLNLLQEYFGRSSAVRTVKITFVSLLLFALFSQLHLLYTPSCYDTAHYHYKALLEITPRLVVASFIAYGVVSYLDTRLNAFLKNKIPWPATRNGLCVAVTQALDTVLFTLIGLSGVLSSLGDLMLVSYIIKLSCVVIALPFISFAKKLVSPPANANH